MYKFTTLVIALLLLGCGGSGTSTNNTAPEPTPAPAPAPTPSPDPDYPDLTQEKLLTDEELVTPALATEPSPKAEYVEWAQENHKKLRSLTYDQDFSDLEFLQDTLHGKRIVQLGESTHGSRVFNQAKVRLIKYLHQELDYNVMAFEASVTGCHIQNKDISKVSPIDTMQGCIYGVWWADEVIELFDYILSTHSTDKPLILAGFDSQTSAWRDTAEDYAAFFQQIIQHLDASYWPEIEPLFADYFALLLNREQCDWENNAQACTRFDETEQDVLARLENLETFLRSHIDNITAPVEDEFGRDLRLAVISSYSMHAFIEQLKVSDDYGSTNVRDAGMARNLTALAETVYQTEKIIVWAHNFHIRTDDLNPDVTVAGEHLGEYWQEELYTIGFNMIRGEHAFNGGGRGMVNTNHSNDSMEAIAYQLRTAAAFIPFTKEDQATEGDDWLHKPFTVLRWGSMEITLRLADSYDAVIVIDRSLRPQFLN